MKPMRAISGMTCSSAAAALVEVRTTLSSAPRLLRRSVAPALGTASSTGCELVTACTVLMPAVIMLRVRSRSSSGRIMCASAVVVHDAAETSLCLAGSNSKWLMPWMSIVASSGSGTPFCLLLNGELCTTTRAPAAEVAAQRAARLRRARRRGRGTCPVHSTTRATPWSRQGMSLGSRASRRIDELLAVGADQAALLVDHVHVERRRTGRTGSGAAGRTCCPWRCTARPTSSDVPTGRPTLTTMRSKSSRPRWCQSVSLPMRPSPLIPSVRCALIARQSPPVEADDSPARSGPTSAKPSPALDAVRRRSS